MGRGGGGGGHFCTAGADISEGPWCGALVGRGESWAGGLVLVLDTGVDRMGQAWLGHHERQGVEGEMGHLAVWVGALKDGYAAVLDGVEGHAGTAGRGA